MAKEIIRRTKWVGWIYLAGFALLFSGIFQVIIGLAALFNGDVFFVQNGKLLVFDLTVWGWVHLALGILVMCIGTALFSGRAWARVVATLLASLSLIVHFAFLNAHPFWSIIVMILDVVVIYAIVVHGDEVALEY